MDRSQEIFSLFEGACPTCEAPVTLFRASGNRQFIADQGWVMGVPEIDFTTRSEGNGTHTIGAVEFRCQNEHEFYLEYTRHGSWE